MGATVSVPSWKNAIRCLPRKSPATCRKRRSGQSRRSCRSVPCTRRQASACLGCPPCGRGRLRSKLLESLPERWLATNASGRGRVLRAELARGHPGPAAERLGKGAFIRKPERLGNRRDFFVAAQRHFCQMKQFAIAQLLE